MVVFITEDLSISTETKRPNLSLEVSVQSLLPVHWNKKSVPDGYWKTEDAQEKAVRCTHRLFEEILPQERGVPFNLDAINNESLDELFTQHKLKGMLNEIYKGSSVVAVMAAYPNIFKPWEFKKPMHGFWSRGDVSAKVEDAVLWFLFYKLNLTIRHIEKGGIPRALLGTRSLRGCKLTEIERMGIKYDKLLDIAKESKEYAYRLELDNIKRKLELRHPFTSSERIKTTGRLFESYYFIRDKTYPVREDVTLCFYIASLISRVNAPFIKNVAKSVYYGLIGSIGILEFKDLLSIGVDTAISRVIPNYKPEEGYFLPYLKTSLFNQLTREVMNTGDLVREPVHIHRDTYKLTCLIRDMEEKKDEANFLSKCNQLFGFSPDYVKSLNEVRSRRTIYLDHSKSKYSKKTLASESVSLPLEGINRFVPTTFTTNDYLTSTAVRGELESLNPTEAEIVKLRFFEDMPLRDIPQALYSRGLVERIYSTSMIQKWEKQAFNILGKNPALMELWEEMGN